MGHHDIIVMGASAGGLPALASVCRQLPADLPVVVCIVMHTSPNAPGLLGNILTRDSGRLVTVPADGQPLELGGIYIAPPDRHLLLEVGRLRVVRGPRENLHRPSIDPLFRSAAAAFGPRVIGVVLSGMLDDGTAGLLAIKRCGGIALVQDPAEAEFASMPASALAHVAVDGCLPLVALGKRLAELAGEPDVVPRSVAPEAVGDEAHMAFGQHNDPTDLDRLGRPSSFTCPDCHGTLWELDEGAVLRYRCHIGHAYSAESLHAGQAEHQEQALSAALRALEEQATLFMRMARRAKEQGNALGFEQYERRARTHRHDAETLRRMLLRSDPPSPSAPEPGIVA